jgi:outer membrane protein assembly factor BamB
MIKRFFFPLSPSFFKLFLSRAKCFSAACCWALTFLYLVTTPVCSAQGPESWPEFRGPHGNGVVTLPGESSGVPVQWSETENVVWKTEIPFLGWSTPVIMDGQIWLTTATPEGNDFYVLTIDQESGEVLRNEQLFHSDNPEALGNEINSYASPSAAIEKGRVYLHFGSYGTACLNTQSGDVLWQRTDLPCRHYRGPGSSVILFDDLLLLTFDGADLQYLVALNKTTGETVWKTDRSTDWPDIDENGEVLREGDFRKAFTTPFLIAQQDRTLLFSQGSYAAFVYNARTGEELWKAEHGAYSPAPGVASYKNLVYIPIGRGAQEVWAMELAKAPAVISGDAKWKIAGKKVPAEPSLLVVDDLLFMLSNDGIVSCHDALTGEEHWSERIGGNYMASPIFADGKLYCAGMRKKTTVLRADRNFEKLAVNELDEGMLASPVVVGSALYLRTRTHLYRIESGK